MIQYFFPIQYGYFGIVSSCGVVVQCRSVLVVYRAMCFLLSLVQCRDVMVGPKKLFVSCNGPKKIG